ncbi:hypothetical protein E3983_10220 [Legionella israelensis]|uniref:Uncharacterized protein n=1 Tax=Legionella israelensis TaxID=454 RepID=A0AAX1EI01_9GAMM|nr:hypothetical protein [Legionella israelensis]QBR84707.1 hypothetical protein E3983_10220 [Legionella israelensis]
METLNSIGAFLAHYIGWVIFTLIAGLLLIINFWDKIKNLFSPRLKNYDKVHKRIELQKEFDEYLIENIWKKKYRSDVIIRDVKRIDKSYPEAEKSEKIGSWFRIGLLDTYHRGILVGLSVSRLIETPEGIRHLKQDENEYFTAFLVGKIPYDSIENVNWEGDEYYNYPHIFCHFEHKNKEPYEELIYCVENTNNLERKFYTEVAKHEDVINLDKKIGITDY